MSDEVTVYEAKTHLSQLLRRVQDGEEIVIRRGREPVARLVPHVATPRRRKPGGFEGQIWMSDDFNDTLEELADDFGIPR